MSDRRFELELLDEILAILDGTAVTACDVSGDGFSVRVRRRTAREEVARSAKSKPAEPRASDVLHVRSPAVGIFSAERDWRAGDRVERGLVLGGVQSLGQVAEIASPVDGVIRSVVTPSGAPVEFGQALFAIAAE